MISHDGGDTGFLTGLAMLPEKKIAVVWMTNSEWLSSTDGVTHAALDAALGLEPEPITGKRSIAGAMFTTYIRLGIDAAARQYEALKAELPAAYNFGVGELNELGRYMLRRGRTKDAIRIFQLNATAYRSSAKAFDGLGNAYEKDGDRPLAIRHYEKAVELDPKLAHAADALKRLKQ
jgi:tetratricopeptide (TPR) repeat protein